MGNSVAKPDLTPEQEDVKFLGDRVPFGDAELVHLYTAYQQWLHNNSSSNSCKSSSSFLCDWAMQCGAAQSDDPRIASRIKATEEQILPANFGNALYQACFCAPGDVRVYDLLPEEENPGAAASTRVNDTVVVLDEDAPTPPQRQSPRQSPPPPSAAHSQLVDEHTRKARLETFFEGLAGCSRRGAKQTLTVLFDTEYVLLQHATHKNKTASAIEANCCTTRRISARSFVETGYRIALASVYVQSKKDVKDFLPDADREDALQAFAQSIVEKGRRRRQRSGLPGCTTTECPFLQQGLAELADILEWADAVAPMFASILPTFFHFVLFPATPMPRSRTAFDAVVTDSSSVFFTTEHTVMNARTFQVACLSASLTGAYHRLYTSAADGLSFNRLQNAVLGYGGPTLMVIRSTSGGIFGAFTASAWKESKDFYGNTDCFLYQLSPCTAVYRPTANDRNFMYCNSAARSRGYDQQAHGMGFGGDVQEPRLFLPESFDDCVAASQDLTFENGRLLPDVGSSAGQQQQQQHRKVFDIDSLEVWGVGGTETVQSALQARDACRAIADEAIRRARKVDKAQFLDDFRAGTFASKAFAHRQDVDGRADADLNERANADNKDKMFEYAK